MLYLFHIAGFPVQLVLPEPVDIDRLLPSFRPFRYASAERDPLFRLTVADSIPEWSGNENVLDESVNDMGHIRLLQEGDNYRVELRSGRGMTHRMRMNARMDNFRAVLGWNDPLVGQVLSSLLRIACSQAILSREAVSIHASAVYREGKACLFLGKSGTGKSTHTRLWLRHVPGSDLMNDDNPVVRVQEDGVWVYGSPWSGKTPCYRNVAAPVGAFVQLRQHAENRMGRESVVDSFVSLLTSVSTMKWDARIYAFHCDTLSDILRRTPVYLLECRPDEEAAQLSFRTVTANAGGL